MQSSESSEPKYDRDFLLSPAKRERAPRTVGGGEVRDCFGDPDHVHLYGMTPKEWWGRGMRILARTCIEAVKDPFGDAIGGDGGQLAVSGRPREDDS